MVCSGKGLNAVNAEFLVRQPVETPGSDCAQKIEDSLYCLDKKIWFGLPYMLHPSEKNTRNN